MMESMSHRQKIAEMQHLKLIHPKMKMHSGFMK